jgi:hypothetical protein
VVVGDDADIFNVCNTSIFRVEVCRLVSLSIYGILLKQWGKWGGGNTAGQARAHTHRGNITSCEHTSIIIKY